MIVEACHIAADFVVEIAERLAGIDWDLVLLGT